ncbi:hypothetical protein IHV12_05905 [Fictibacillus sp. 7GRE50]|uniref:hypothetical protein n=1 Tax=unclassified Fictibacillus TaxID=2644029 RepID=UPI0018CF9DF1|nr:MULTISPECIES: hypothetical protein [unclassified Fictibacillus]MBH0164442.1 hypothetical protein [Fictibacillus sp. 7GRE50]MBH0175646.1 hypothetical protein [Fictibacillus sp. 23RED33]
MGRTVSLLPLCAIRSLHQSTRPIGVGNLPLQSTCNEDEKTNLKGRTFLKESNFQILSSMIVDWSERCETPAGQAGSPKSGSGSLRPDKQKVNGFEGALCLLSHLTFDLEGLATATRQVRHLRVKRPNVAHGLPHGKRASVTEINHFQKQCLQLLSIRSVPVS